MDNLLPLMLVVHTCYIHHCTQTHLSNKNKTKKGRPNTRRQTLTVLSIGTAGSVGSSPNERTSNLSLTNHTLLGRSKDVVEEIHNKPPSLLTMRQLLCQQVGFILMGIDISGPPLIPRNSLSHKVISNTLRLLLQG